MSAPCVVVVGEALVDEFEDRSVVGGAPFNVARSLSALGLPVLMVTRIGRDAAGALVHDSFERYGLDRAGLQIDEHHPTGRVRVERRGDDHRFEILSNQAWDHLDAGAALACLDDREVALLYCGTLAQRAPASRAAVRALLDAVAAPHFVDLNLRAGQFETAVIADTLQRAQKVKVNDEELRSLLAWFDDPAAPDLPWGSAASQAAIRRLMAHFGLDQLVVTRGGEGATCFEQSGGRVDAAPSPLPGPWGDAVGAGDSFAAVFLAGSLLGWPLETTLRRANEFAAAICCIVGAVPDDPLAFYAPWRAAWRLDRA